MSKFTKGDLASPDDPNSGYYASDTFLSMLNDLYRIVKQRTGRELALNSACRTPAHNTKVGGASKSKHLTTTPGGCMAVDIDCRDDSYRAAIINAAIEIGFKGFGLANGFIHLDARTQQRASVWGYGASTDWLMNQYEDQIRNGASSQVVSHANASPITPAPSTDNWASFDFSPFTSWFKQDDMEYALPLDADTTLHHQEVKAKKNWLIIAIAAALLTLVLLVFAALYTIKK